MTTATTVPDPGSLTPAAARAALRAGTRGPTSGWCVGYAQVNLIAVPVDWAYDVLLFCQRNPKPCPVLDVTDAGSARTVLAPDADLRTDLPGYRVWRDGVLTEQPTEVTTFWRDDLVCFLLGCSFTFDTALAEAWLPLRHVEQQCNVSMYTTNRQCRPAGRVHGPLVVSMRPIPNDLVDSAVRLTARMPSVHGAPVHTGDPAVLGIADLARPDFGDPVRAHADDVPVFWACGVTPQAAVVASRPPFAITHQPGQMFITDIPDTDYKIC